MEVVEYWHGTIKNYRYDGDVSVAGCLGARERLDVRAVEAGCLGPVASGGCAAVVDDAPGAGCPGPWPDVRGLGRCSWLLPLVLLIRGLGDFYIFMHIFGRALLVPNHAQHLGLR